MPHLRRRPAVVPRSGAGLTLVLALTLSGCASLSPAAPAPSDPASDLAPSATASPATTPAPTSSATPPDAGPARGLLAVEVVGGMCSSGEECRRVLTVAADGTWRSADETGAVEEGRVDDGLLAQVAGAVATADRDRLTATPFAGECERNMDGKELLITLRPGEPDELVLSSCVYELPTEGPLLDAVVALREATA